jgi:hypothetical protein
MTTATTARIRTSLYNINPNFGEWVYVPATIPARKVAIAEDEAVTPQGVEYQLARDDFKVTLVAGGAYIAPVPEVVIGDGEQYVPSLGGIYAKVRSCSGSPSRIRVIEYE